MARKFKNNVGANTRPLIGGKEYKAPPEPPNLAMKFMRENRGGIPDEDTPAMTLAGEPVSAETPPAPVATTDTPPAEPVVPDAAAPPPSDAPPVLDPAAQAALDAAEPPKTPADASGTSADVPSEVQPTAQTEPSQPAAAPPRDKYDFGSLAKVLDENPEWAQGDIGDNIVRGLQERATLQEEIAKYQPAVAERDQLLKAFGAPDVKSALGIVEPFIRAIRENPERGKMLDAVAAMDPATLNYVSQLLEDWKQLPVDQRAAFGQVGPTTQQTPTDPRYEKLAQNQTLLEESLLKTRAEREVTGILGEWPFLRQDRKAWEAIQSAATAMWNEDEAKGIPPLQRRGYMEAIATNRHFLEIMKAAQERRVMQHATAATQPPSQLGQPPAPSAILPATHPQPPVAARPPRKEYRGSVDGAAAAFLADQGYTK
jgi:hypothetical protein